MHALTYRHSVDGVGITIVVAVVAVLPAVATGHDENAPEAPATRYHAVLQGSLRRRNRGWSGHRGRRALPMPFPADPRGLHVWL